MIKIMVDSASDCRDARLYDILVPMSVQIGDKTYRDGVDLDHDAFYALLTESQVFHRTSQPSPADFAAHFEQAKQNGDEIVYLAISSALSGTYQSAHIAKKMAGYDGVYLVDTAKATHAIGLIARQAHGRFYGPALRRGRLHWLCIFVAADVACVLEYLRYVLSKQLGGGKHAQLFPS